MEVLLGLGDRFKKVKVHPHWLLHPRLQQVDQLGELGLVPIDQVFGVMEELREFPHLVVVLQLIQ